MSDVLRTIVWFIWRRDSDAAQCVCISIASYMDTKGIRDMRDYFSSLHGFHLFVNEQSERAQAVGGCDGKSVR